MQPSRDDFVIAIRSVFLKKGNQQRFSLLSLILFSLLFLILGNFNFKIIEFNRTVIKEIIYVSSFIVTVPENVIKKSFKKTADHFEFYNKYINIKNELEVLKDRDLSKRIIKYENIELKKLINDYFIEDSQVYAKVMIDKESKYLRSIIINKGSKNGIKVGMIAYDDIYLVGKVVEVNFLTSRVLLISDINSKVPVTIQPLNVEAIMSGLETEKGKIQYVKNEKLINQSNEELIVVTSGIGGIFKSGIPIGKIETKNFLDSNEIIVNFYKDFSQLKYIKVLSITKDNANLDQSNKKIFEENTDQILIIENQEKNIEILQQRNNISKEIRNKLEKENIQLNNKFVNIQKQFENQKKK